MRKLLTALLCGFCISPAFAGSDVLEEEHFHWGKTLYCKGDSVLMFATSTKLDIDNDADIRRIEQGGLVTCSLFSKGEMTFISSDGLRYGDLYTVFFDEFNRDGVRYWRWRYKEE